MQNYFEISEPQKGEKFYDFKNYLFKHKDLINFGYSVLLTINTDIKVFKTLYYKNSEILSEENTDINWVIDLDKKKILSSLDEQLFIDLKNIIYRGIVVNIYAIVEKNKDGFNLYYLKEKLQEYLKQTGKGITKKEKKECHSIIHEVIEVYNFIDSSKSNNDANSDINKLWKKIDTNRNKVFAHIDRSYRNKKTEHLEMFEIEAFMNHISRGMQILSSKVYDKGSPITSLGTTSGTQLITNAKTLFRFKDFINSEKKIKDMFRKWWRSAK